MRAHPIILQASAVTSYAQRYLNGDHEAVWAELRAQGPIPPALAEDCSAVAAETMRRAARHVVRLADALTELGLGRPGSPLIPPSAADLPDLDALAGEIGGLPAAFEACLRHIGYVSFSGDCPALELSYESGDQYGVAGLLPDPLVLPDIAFLRDEWTLYLEQVEEDPELAEEGFWFEFAPDELHKANISGSTHDILLPSIAADPVIRGVGGRDGITLVEYLRMSISWGGMPGWSFGPDRAPAALTGLRAAIDF
jgi:hypothetical protein